MAKNGVKIMAAASSMLAMGAQASAIMAGSAGVGGGGESAWRGISDEMAPAIIA